MAATTCGTWRTMHILPFRACDARTTEERTYDGPYFQAPLYGWAELNWWTQVLRLASKVLVQHVSSYAPPSGVRVHMCAAASSSGSSSTLVIAPSSLRDWKVVRGPELMPHCMVACGSTLFPASGHPFNGPLNICTGTYIRARLAFPYTSLAVINVQTPNFKSSARY